LRHHGENLKSQSCPRRRGFQPPAHSVTLRQIHLTFIVSAIGFAVVDRLGQFTQAKPHKTE